MRVIDTIEDMQKFAIEQNKPYMCIDTEDGSKLEMAVCDCGCGVAGIRVTSPNGTHGDMSMPLAGFISVINAFLDRLNQCSSPAH